MLILLVVGFLVAAPLVALASGGWTHAMAQRSQLVQAASRRQVTAVVLTAAALRPAGHLAGQGRTALRTVAAPAGFPRSRRHPALTAGELMTALTVLPSG